MPKPVLRATPTLFESKQVQFAIGPNTFTALETENYSRAELISLWNRVLFKKHSETKVKFLGKNYLTWFFSYLRKTPNEFYSTPNWNWFNAYNVLGVGQQDHLQKTAPLFASDWFADAFLALFVFPCFFLSQSGKSFSAFLFLQNVLPFLLMFYMPVSIKYRIFGKMTSWVLSLKKFS